MAAWGYEFFLLVFCSLAKFRNLKKFPFFNFIFPVWLKE